MSADCSSFKEQSARMISSSLERDQGRRFHLQMVCSLLVVMLVILQLTSWQFWSPVSNLEANPTTGLSLGESESASSELPYLVMFVGPGKTATTTIQDALTRLETKGILAQDNFLFLGKRSPESETRWSPMVEAMIPYHQRTPTGCFSKNVTECWMKYALPDLNHLASQKKNILIHEEYLHRSEYFDRPAFKRAVDHRFRVIFILGYRRKWSWEISMKNQWEKMMPDAWPKESNSDVGHMQGVPTRSPPFFRLKAALHRFPFHATADSYGNWNPHSSFRVFSLHHGEPIRHFLCDVLPEAKHSCQNAEIVASEIEPENQSINLDHHLIAVEAASRGLVDTEKFQRGEVVSSLAKCSENFGDIPQECLERNEMELYLNNSLAIEREIVEKFRDTSPYLETLLTPEAEEKHKKSFWKSTAKFCSANITAIMADQKWLDCFDAVNSK